MPHLHLDVVGGIAGDMFCAALLDCNPEIESSLMPAIAAAGFEDLVSLEILPHNDGVLTGKRFNVEPLSTSQDENHHHRHYSEIRTILEGSSLEAPAKAAALAIFRILAKAEADVHDKDVESVAFHEVGAWDSIADIVCASVLIHKLNIQSASCSALPLGSGRVKTAHGMLPVPAPATALILEGFEFNDDGIGGERVTPTGAAILKYLVSSRKPNGTLKAQGFGFGTKKMPGISNTLRALLIETSITEQTGPWLTQRIHQIEFEIDDQTPEQLAEALTKLQALDQVLDVVQYAATGKKNRLCHGIRVLASKNVTKVITRCFQLTTTLGLRHTEVTRYALERSHHVVNHEGEEYRIKVAKRPDGVTSKIEMDDMVESDSYAEQEKLRRRIELELKQQLSEDKP